MASVFGSPPSFSQPLTKTTQYFYTTSSQPPPPRQPDSSAQPPQQLSAGSVQPPKPLDKYSNKKGRIESTDWIASSLTRRFGLGAGLAWAGFLAAGVISEQLKTRFEVSQQQANTRDAENQEEVVLPNGIRYYDIRVGGGASPRLGDLVVIDLKGEIRGEGKVFVDTFGKEKKPLALVVGSRPYSKGMCEGVEYALRTMKAGGKRKVVVPPSLGFGKGGADFGSGVEIPEAATLEYVVEVERVSIAPA